MELINNKYSALHMESFLECNTRERGFTFKLEEMTRRSCEVTRETHQEWQSTLANLLGQTIEMFRLQRKKKSMTPLRGPLRMGEGRGESLSLLLNFSHLISLYPQDILVRHLTGAHSSHRRDLC